ncbi:response regulator transcription factor [Pseudoalteromonas sp. BDTF-M6]|uniref:response regulator transcription factor n=1 Tax=Pseudoalteromonas sp. BDTF-M6 TaxID=2796132 RepID=UPI001BAEBD94|nr:response regulator transcription factor [Pseudoalteromonas sp. BDTF-M6]MBS3798107.1 response regulator transcription factor [Pseudoalteromonas sp. BDTF-M6]
MVQIALVDDHSIVREGFKRLLELNDSYTVTLEASSFSQAESVIAQSTFDVAIIDISLPDKNGLELIPLIKHFSPKAKVIVVSMYDNDPYVSEAINLGADAYLSKQYASDEILEAISNTLSGGSYLGSDIIKNIRFNLNSTAATKMQLLTKRERDVFNLLAIGYSVTSVSKELNIAAKTVHAHKSNIYDKLQITESYELLKMAIKSHSIKFEELLKE